jgi:hypothetical protein
MQSRLARSLPGGSQFTSRHPARKGVNKKTWHISAFCHYV